MQIGLRRLFFIFRGTHAYCTIAVMQPLVVEPLKKLYFLKKKNLFTSSFNLLGTYMSMAVIQPLVGGRFVLSTKPKPTVTTASTWVMTTKYKF